MKKKLFKVGVTIAITAGIVLGTAIPSNASVRTVPLSYAEGWYKVQIDDASAANCARISAGYAQFIAQSRYKLLYASGCLRTGSGRWVSNLTYDVTP